MNTVIINDFKVDIVCRPKNIKNINIRIHDGKIFLTYPLKCSKNRALAFLDEHTEWLSKNYKPAKISIFEKKEVNIFGEKYLVEVDSMQKEKIILKNGVIVLNQACEDLIFNYFKDEFIETFNKVQKIYQNILKKEVIIKFRMMKTKWGSCNFKKYIITINKKLMYYEKRCLEYVMFHEFTHFIIPNHSKDFYKELSKYYNNHEKIKIELKE